MTKTAATAQADTAKPAIISDASPRKLEIILPKRCGDCTAYRGSEIQGKCRRNPPKPFMFLLPPTMVGGAPQHYSVSDWPIVGPDQDCETGFERRKEGMQ